MSRIFGALALSLFTILSACQQQEPKPEDKLKTFLGAVRSKRGQEAWDLLSTRTRTELERRAARIAQITQDPRPSKVDVLLFQQMEMMTIRIPESITVVSPISATATLRVSLTEGQTAKVEMIKEADGWKVDLLRSLTPIPTSTRAEPPKMPKTPAIPSP